jgi:sugar lactone lactonase YvrE
MYPNSFRKLHPVFIGGLMLIALVSAAAQSAASSYAFSHLAGPLGGPGNADGLGTAARFWNPTGVATDGAGNTYVADASNSTIRKISPGGAVTTLAGTPNFPGPSSISTPGTSTPAAFNYPTGLAVDSTGAIYVADQGQHTILKITPGGIVTTLAGVSGVPGSADGTGTAAQFSYPSGVAVDSAGNVYVADSGNHLIRRITPTGSVITVAGTAGLAGNSDGVGTTAQFNSPLGIAVDNAGNVYVADTSNNAIRKISPSAAVTTVAGTAGVTGAADGTGTAAQFDNPTGVTVDSAGNLFVADEVNQTIRKITPGGIVTTLAGTVGATGFANGTGATARFDYPSGVAIDRSGNVIVADQGNSIIRQITPSGAVTTPAGDAAQFGSADGTGTAARFGWTVASTVDASGNIYVSEIGVNSQGITNMIRKITPGGTVTTLATVDTKSLASNGTFFLLPTGIAVDSTGNIYVTNWFDHTVRRVTPAGTVTVLAGTAGVAGSADGTGAAAQFNYPTGLALDPAGNLYVADDQNATIRKITPTGVVTTLAGTAGIVGSANGTGPAAQFINPTSLAVDATGNVFVADSGNNMIRKITPGGVVTTLASQVGVYSGLGGSASTVNYYYPVGLAVDAAGNIYAGVGSTIQRITPAGVVTTLAGIAGICGSMDGVGSAAQFNIPYGVAVDSAGNLYVADLNNGALRKGVPVGLPVITAQPLSQAAASGGNVLFTVSASSVATLTYQWYLNGNALSGATGNSLSLAGVTAANGGDYTVVVGNGSGSVTSNKATLTISSAPVPPPAAGSGGGGGAPSVWFLAAVSLLACARRHFTRKG